MISRFFRGNSFASVSSVKGMHDLVGNELLKHSFIKHTSFSVLEKYGYRQIVPNILEHKQIFSRTLGETSEIISKEMYGFNDQSGKELVLRPEGTASVMRHVLEQQKDLEPVQKLSYYGPMFRYERPQVGRQRQFYQLGCEYIHRETGNSAKNNYLLDAEVIFIASTILSKVLADPQNSVLEINSLGDRQDRDIYNEALTKYYTPHMEQLSELSRIRLLKKNPLRIFDSKEAQDASIIENAPTFKDSMNVNPRLVRGLDYYSHTCFEFKDASRKGKSQDTLAAGGRYDSLSSILSGKLNNSNGVGFACGVERLAMHIDDNDARLTAYQPPKIKVGVVAVAADKSSEEVEQKLKLLCMKILTEINSPRIEVHFLLHSHKIDKQMDFLLKREFTWGVFVGEAEMSRGEVTVKNLKTRETILVKNKDITNFDF